jgi:6-phosphogluconolactonase
VTRFADAPIEVLDTPDALARAAADWLLDIALNTDGAFAIALSGGSTPKALYHLLATPPWRDRFPFDRAHWFWGDERFVPPGDPRSNQRMVREALLDHVPIPPANIHPIETVGESPDAAAAAYERALKAFYRTDPLDAARPLFEVVLLGLGTDGHTASLFPGTSVLDERTHWTAAVIGAQTEPRITLTYPALESSRHTAFLVAGADKTAMLQRLRAGDATLPAARLQPQGDLVILADAAATGRG